MLADSEAVGRIPGLIILKLRHHDNFNKKISHKSYCSNLSAFPGAC